MVETQGDAPPEQYEGEAKPRADLYAPGAAMDQAARARYQTAVAHQAARRARHLFHVTRSLDGQLARLDTQGRRAGPMPRYSSLR
jgi:hypothetical protein